ncbi:MAG: hypothetical protein Rhims3KO_15120 [Hyphomicrobiales bacterium]
MPPSAGSNAAQVLESPALAGMVNAKPPAMLIPVARMAVDAIDLKCIEKPQHTILLEFTNQ